MKHHPPPDGGDHGSHGSGGDNSSDAKSVVPSKKVFMMKPEIKYFKNLDPWDNFQEWHDDFVATCGGTGLRNHMDFECEPNEDERTHFDGLDRWLHVILKARLHITKGIDIPRQEKETLSGRTVLFRPWKHTLSSAVADLTAEQRLIDITNMSLDASWNKSALSFINKEVETHNSTCMLHNGRGD